MIVMSSWPMIVRPTRRGAWIGKSYSCISHHNCYKTGTPGHSGLDFKKKMFAHFSSPSRFWVFLTGYVLATKGLVTFVWLACFHWSNQSVSWTLGFVSVAKLGTLAREESLIALPFLTRWLGAVLLEQHERWLAWGTGVRIFFGGMNSTVCFENWIRRHCGVAGDVGA